MRKPRFSHSSWLHQRHDMRAPRIKGCSLLGIKAVTLIDADHTGA
jgi:hypothetical protein